MSFLDQPLINIFLKPKRMIGEIEVQVVINESTNDTLTVTKQPVQQGASTADHSYKEPTVFNTTIYFSNDGNLAKTYQNLQDLQNSRVPFDIITPKRKYSNMLMTVLGQTTDKSTENTLAITASFQEIIIVFVTTTTLQRSTQKQPQVTSPIENAGRKSALKSLSEAVLTIGGVIGK